MKRRSVIRGELYQPVTQWLRDLWGNPEPTAQKEYDSAVEATFNSPQGAIVLKYWLSEIYFQRCYIPGTNQTRSDTDFHLGQCELIQAVLETLDRVAHKSPPAVEQQDVMKEFQRPLTMEETEKWTREQNGAL